MPLKPRHKEIRIICGRCGKDFIARFKDKQALLKHLFRQCGPVAQGRAPSS